MKRNITTVTMSTETASVSQEIEIHNNAAVGADSRNGNPDKEQNAAKRQRQFNPHVPCDTVSTVSYNSDDSENAGEHKAKLQHTPSSQLYRNTEKTLQSSNNHLKRTPSFQSYWDTKKTLQLSNQRRSNGNFEYKFLPELTEKQQCLSEFGLPLVIPMIFFWFNFSSFGFVWCTTIVVGHTIETMLTNFGESVRELCAVDIIPRLAHHFLDCVWLHSLISAMLLFPDRFVRPDDLNNHGGDRTVINIGLILIQTLPIYLAVSFKTDFLRLHRNHLQEVSSSPPDSSLMSIQYFIRSCFIWYFAATALILITSLSSQTRFLMYGGVSLFNVTPLILFRSYSKIALQENFCIENSIIKQRKLESETRKSYGSIPSV